jgi:hypothetical protein
MARQGQQVDLTIRTAALARERRTAAKAAHILTSLIFFPICQHGQPTNLDSFYKQPDTWTALISSPLSKDSSLQHVKGSKSRPASMGSTSPSSLPLRVPPSNTMQHIHVTCRIAPAAAGQHLQLLQLQLLDSTLDNSFSSCSFWQHLQGQQLIHAWQHHLHTASSPWIAPAAPARDSSNPSLLLPTRQLGGSEHMLLTAAAKAAGQQHPLTPFSANPSWQQGQKGGESKGGDHPEIRKIKGESGLK